MSEQVTLRRARVDEAQAIHAVIAAAFHGLSGRGYSEAAILSAEAIGQRLLGGANVLVADAGGAVVGTVTGLVEHQTLRVCSLAVHPHWQGRGVGRRLMEALEDIARQSGCRKLWLQTGWAMAEAIALYRALGYEQEGYQAQQLCGEDFCLFGKVLEDEKRPPGDVRSLVTSAQTTSAARQAGLSDDALRLSGLAVLTFSRTIVERLTELCALRETQWISALHHPYAAAELVKRGRRARLEVTVLVPPMGASPLACIVEDLVACGVEAVFLVCAAWSLGPPVEVGDLIVPSFSVGPDGTSIHYGNRSGHVAADPQVVAALASACRERGGRVHVGGNASCEALYGVTPQMAEGFRRRGCLSVENGEASTLLAVAQMLGVLGGVLFQPYIELAHGWQPGVLRDERYGATCRIQAEAVLQAGVRLQEAGLLGQRGESAEPA